MLKDEFCTHEPLRCVILRGAEFGLVSAARLPLVSAVVRLPGFTGNLGLLGFRASSRLACRFLLILRQSPGGPFLGVLHLKAEFGQAVADGIARGPVLGRFGLGTEFEEHVNGCAESLFAL